MTITSFDYETSSIADIRKVGSYRYANDPSTVILMFAIAKDDGPVMVWNFLEPDSIESQCAREIFEEAVAQGHILRGFNIQFEVAISKYVLTRQIGIREPRLEQYRCTQALCNRAALRTSLGDAVKDVGLPSDQQKDARGKALIELFCNRGKMKSVEPPPGMKDPDTIKWKDGKQVTQGKKPKNRKTGSPIHDEEILWDWLVKLNGEKMTVREAWELFIEYCRQDVVAERALAARLAKFELEGDILDSFQFDLRMNYRGVPVNRQALRHAQKLVEQFSSRMETRFKNISGLTSNQNAKLLLWLQERGYPYDNLQADTVEEGLKAKFLLTAEAAEILEMRSLLSFAALKKIPTMLLRACDDGYIRGITRWHNARTGRATGEGAQMQNVKKATIPDSKLAYQLICEGIDLEIFAMMWGSPLETIASCARHFIQPHEGQMLDADYAGVEARITPWLSGDTGKLDSILAGIDQYKAVASKLFGIPYDKVSKEQRTIAKPVELGCCFGVGGRGLQKALLDNHQVDRSLKECKEWVKIYRDNHQPTVQCWKDIENAAKLAITDGKRTAVADGKLVFGRERYSGIVYLVMRLPSGRKLYYPHPQIKRVWKAYTREEMAESEWKRERKGYEMDQITFYGRVKDRAWGRVATYSSKLFENAVQAIGADLLNYGCVQCEKEGYDVRLIIHDQILGLDNGLSLEGFAEAFCRKQPWAETFPLAAEAARVPFYLKDD